MHSIVAIIAVRNMAPGERPIGAQGNRHQSDAIREKAMGRSKLLAYTALVCASSVLLAGAAHAIDLTGAWATDTSACAKVFVKKGNRTVFRQDSDMYGSGFIMEGPR